MSLLFLFTNKLPSPSYFKSGIPDSGDYPERNNLPGIKKKIIVRLLIPLLLIVFIFILTWLRPVVVISVKRAEGSPEDIYGHFLLPGERFTLRYLHSVEKTPVEENYQTTWSGDIALASTSFQSYGAGLPLSLRNFSLKKGIFWIENPGISLPEIRIRVSRTPGQTLIFKNKFNQQEYNLQIMAHPGELITIHTISLTGWFFKTSSYLFSGILQNIHSLSAATQT